MKDSANDTTPLIEKMKELEWKIVCQNSPQWAQAYLEQLHALSGPISLVLAKAQLLERSLVPHVEELKRQGKFPDFSELKAQALRELAR